MRYITTLLVSLFIANFLNAQSDLSADKWQADLRFLQKTVHKDYSFLFKKISQEDFDKEVQKFHKAIPQMASHEIIVGFSRIVSLFQYGHTSVGLSSWSSRGPKGFQQMPFNLYHYNNGLFIQGTHQKYANSLGAKVVAIEGKPVAEVLKAIRPVVPAENDQYFKAFGMNYIGIPEVLHAQDITKERKQTITLSLEKDGKSFDQTFAQIQTNNYPGKYSHILQAGEWLDARDQSNTPLYLKNLDKIYYYEYLPEHKAVYVRHSQIQDDPSEDIPTFYSGVFDFIEKNEVERLIIDVRLNGGGNNYKNKPVITGILGSEKINELGKLFVIIGRRTFSACQNLVNELSNYTPAIFVGEPTAENINFYGDVNVLELPNSQLPVRLSFAWWQDKPQWENADWTAPHLAVDMSFEEYSSNQDPVLDAALNFSDSEFIVDPMAHLTQLFMKGEIEQLRADAKQIVENPTYRFFDFEGQFNNAGYRLIGQGQLEPALFIFQMNTELFPESANAWDSYAEGLWRTGKKELAIENYNKAISLDPKGEIGDNARMMMAKIKAEE